MVTKDLGNSQLDFNEPSSYTAICNLGNTYIYVYYVNIARLCRPVFHCLCFVLPRVVFYYVLIILATFINDLGMPRLLFNASFIWLDRFTTSRSDINLCATQNSSWLFSRRSLVRISSVRRLGYIVSMFRRDSSCFQIRLDIGSCDLDSFIIYIIIVHLNFC